MQGKQAWRGRTVVALTALAGLLIWSKLRLVTDFPRTVLADPEEELVLGNGSVTGIEAERDDHATDEMTHPDK